MTHLSAYRSTKSWHGRKERRKKPVSHARRPQFEILESRELLAVYYVSNGGNDNADGLSDATAWATVGKVNSFAFASGDDVYFNSNDSWGGQQLMIDWGGTANDRVTIGAYYMDGGNEVVGVSGNKPVIDGNDAVPGEYAALVQVQASDYTDIENLRVINSEGRGVAVSFSSNNRVSNVETYNTYREGIISWRSDTGIFEDNDVSEASRVWPEFCGLPENSCSWPGALVIASGGPNLLSFGNIVRRNVVYENYGEGIGLYQGPYNNIVEDNILYANRAVQIYVDASYDNIIRNNLVYGTTDPTYWRAGFPGIGIEINDETGQGFALSENNKIYNNVVAYSRTGISIATSYSDSVFRDSDIYNNTFIDNLIGIDSRGNGPWQNSFVRNNIIWAISGDAELYGGRDNHFGLTFENNNWSSPPPVGGAGVGDVIGVPNISKTTGWRSMVGGDLTYQDFALTSSSPGIDQGMTVPAYDANALDPTSVWPNINTLDQNNFGSGWEMGAFVYDPGGGGGNQAPTAVGDSYNTGEDTQLIVPVAGVLTNDTDPENDPLTAVLVAGASNGSVTLNADGSFTYTPITGFTGSDSFTYKANDGTQDSNTTTVDLTVDATQTTTVTFTSIAVEDGYLIESTETSNVGGSINSTGSAGGALRAGDNGGDKQFKGVVSFDTSSIPNGATIVSATLRLRRGSLAGSNPFTSGFGQARVDIKGGMGFNGSTTLEAADFQATADAVDVAQLSNAPNNNDWSEGTLNSTGESFIDTTGKTQFRFYFDLDDNDNASGDNIGWYSGDNATAANRPELVVEYQLNQAPTAVDDSYSTAEDMPLTVLALGTPLGLLDNDTDPENDPLTAVLVTGASNGSVALNADGSFTYTPIAGFTGSDSFTYEANDGTTNSNVATVTITVAMSDLEIVHASTAPIIDGVMESAWNDTTAQAISNLISGSVSGGNDLSGSFRMMWDTNNLYLLAEITDDVQQNDSGSQQWKDDSVELYIDANDDNLSDFGATDYQYSFVWNGASVTVKESKNNATAGVSAARVATANGYLMEVSVPWSTLQQMAVIEGALVGVDVQVNDDDDGGTRDGKLSWFNTVDTSWLDPSTFATANLGPIAATADFDSDGDTDGYDFLMWQRGFGTPAPDATIDDGDADVDKDVDGDDLAIWQNTFGAGAALQLASETGPAVGSITSISGVASELTETAAAMWIAAGADASRLTGLDIQVRNLDGNLLGMAFTNTNTIVIDSDAAGRGWFVDQTPWDDYEFDAKGFLIGNDDADGVDLLSVLAHEMGHLLGVDHEEGNDSLMSESLGARERRLPSLGSAYDIAFASMLEEVFWRDPTDD